MAKFEEEKVINALHTEKAEEYVNKRPFIHLLGRNTIFIQKEFKDAILWALAEGRKEGYELGYNEKFVNTCMKAEEFDKYLKLVKENEQLIKESIQTEIDFAKARDRISELEKELDNYKAFESHYEEIEEDAKVIAKENEQLKEKISVLLSCKDCPENKGGYICEKEYNDKCLAQKIEYIKELKAQIEKMKCCFTCKHKNDCVIEDYNNVCEKWEIKE